MSLLQFELKKLLINKVTLSILAALFVLSATMGSLPNLVSFGSVSNYKVYSELANAYTGPINAERAAIATAESENIEERYGENREVLQGLRSADPVLAFNLDYADYVEYVDEYYHGASTDDPSNPYGIYPLQNKLNTLEQNGDTSSFDYRRTAQQLEVETSLGAPKYANTSLWDTLFGLWSSIIPILFLFIPLAFIIAPVFSLEASTGMDNIVLSTKHGRKRVVTAKLATVSITSAAVTLTYMTATFLGNFLAMGSFVGADAALRSVTTFIRTPLAMSVWQYAIVAAIWLLFMGIVFGIATAFISSKMKSLISTFGISLILLFSTIVLRLAGSNLGTVLNLVVDFGFTSVFLSSNIFKEFIVYSIFGIAVPYWTAALMVMTILCAAGTFAIYRFQRSRTAI
jgi:hypothetical protein